LIQIDAALRQLEAADPELAEIVEWHFFAGLSFVDIAAARGVTERTVRRHWEMARAFLLDALPGLASGAGAED
jgi:DNA-directed RNA polymerase specialized sigma24 family protein